MGGVGYITFRSVRKAPVNVSIAPKPTSAPTTIPTTAATAPPSKPKNLMDIVRAHYPDFPTTQPLMVPLARAEAAKLIINDPVYLDANGELWITRADAESTPTVFKTVNDQGTHVVRENVVYVHRWPDTSKIWWPQLICRKPEGGYEIVTRTARQDIPGNYNYDWSAAYSWNEAIVVPTDRGISIIRPDRRPMEIYHEFISADAYQPGKYSHPLSLLDWRGLVAWMPWENGKSGSKGAARFVGETWTPLDSPNASWPDKLLHLVPLLDGSIIQIAVDDEQNARVGLAVLDPAAVDEKKITDLVDQLSDAESEKRNAAFNELTRYGSSIWPILEKQLEAQSPEAKIRLQQLLRAKIQPTLGGMTLQPGPIKVLGRGDFGSVILYADAGVELPREDENTAPRIVNPAWIDIEPGKPIELLSPTITEELKAKRLEIQIVRGELFLNDEVQGPRWWLSNHFDPLLKPKDLQYRQVVGQDGRGRWLFRKNLSDAAPTLIVDPTLPDPTPRLPVWIYKVEEGSAGWTADSWPAVKKGGAWALIKNDWHVLDETKDSEKFYSRDNPQPSPATAPTTSPSTTEPVAASTNPSSAPTPGEALLTDASGNRYFDGRQTLVMIDPSGKQTTWELPPEAVGSANYDPILFQAGENRLFLLNSVGRLLRIRPTPGAAQPFKLEASFTHRIPTTDEFDRIWIDPAGRIVIAYAGNTLAICFPDGHIPAELAEKLTASDIKDAQE